MLHVALLPPPMRGDGPAPAAGRGPSFTWSTSTARGITYAAGVSVAQSDPQAVERMRQLRAGACYRDALLCTHSPSLPGHDRALTLHHVMWQLANRSRPLAAQRTTTTAPCRTHY